ncbi:Pyrroline-5-carboxylate reductase [Neolecta irregularis DAH-3]|uniref:Pyrroline-5-carboxylate reductase n=1 Tax=Neolecta irregularis (strain DAH-3) TaxID=1198029 RepID=A0A1U7LKT7_NEOID|nr:Pyrroline-5-carboxylate reductase [Neolecta irregularis DAH-3]|eukprot:OLL23264.1 Pyrroline-5-carboxylate reductase [Neolecta irregularis DAH-3]
MSTTLCILGCGTMGKAILSGILSSDDSTVPSNFIACVKRPASKDRLHSLFPKLRIFVGDNVAGVNAADIVLLGSKPQICKEILSQDGMREALEGKLLISILAGTRLSQLHELCNPSTHIIRAMPNTPTKIRQGMTVLVPDNTVTDLERDLTECIFKNIGLVTFLEEKHIDIATALCGSGPAFICTILEAMTDGGVMMGLPRPIAQELVAQSMQGTARMVLAGEHPALIRDDVATPGGCTIGGLLAMEDGKIRSTLARAVQQAAIVAEELGRK